MIVVVALYCVQLLFEETLGRFCRICFLGVFFSFFIFSFLVVALKKQFLCFHLFIF